MNTETILDSLVGKSESILKIKESIHMAAPLSRPVLILGETGTGKEEVARCIHNLSSRSKKKFIPINCANIQRELSESELFGHKKGAFSGAIEARKGLFLEAQGGTVFLDEIADMSMEIQAKLLRVLDGKGELKQLGSDEVIDAVNFRLIAATNKNLTRMQETGTFRKDLYHRICGFMIRIPSLEDRLMDLPHLALHFAKPKVICDKAIAYLAMLKYEGNIRTLRSIVELARDVCTSDVIDAEHMKKAVSYHFDLDISDGNASLQIDTLISQIKTGEVGFLDMRKWWKDRCITADQLNRTLLEIHALAGGRVATLARMLNCKTPAEKKRFTSWLRYLRMIGTVRLQIMNE